MLSNTRQKARRLHIESKKDTNNETVDTYTAKNQRREGRKIQERKCVVSYRKWQR